MILNSIIFAISLSMDSLGIGITYGLKKTKILLSAKFILFVISFLIAFLSINIGGMITKFLSPEIAKYIGVILIISMGIAVIIQATKKDDKEIKSEEIKKKVPKIHKLFIKPLGITVQIIRDPISSDLDNSKTIDSKEAIYLGLALSLDSFATGIGISTFGVNGFLFPIFVGIFQVIFLSIGNFFGRKIQSVTKVPSNIWTIISGVLLIVIGIVKIFI